MATEKRLKGYDPITLESFTRHMTKHREPYDQYDMGYIDAFDQIENWLEYNTVDAVEVVHGRWENNLLANGVTFQKWIPVSERLPKHEDAVLCFIKNGEQDILQFDIVENTWVGQQWTYNRDAVSHWMPLPNPPQEV